MEEDIIRLYQEAIALLRLRNNGMEIYGEYECDFDDKTKSFVLKYVVGDKLRKMRFKPMSNETEALKYFIKCSQNLYNLR